MSESVKEQTLLIEKIKQIPKTSPKAPGSSKAGYQYHQNKPPGNYDPLLKFANHHGKQSTKSLQTLKLYHLTGNCTV